MPSSVDNTSLITTKVVIRDASKDKFIGWQAKLNEIIAGFPGFVSLEILSPVLPQQPKWVIVQRFTNSNKVSEWRSSKERQKLFDELKTYLSENNKSIEEDLGLSQCGGGVTEVFVTQVSSDKEKEYLEWISKIHKEEAKFPGFRGAYVQSPREGRSRNWITFLQFDTPENLDRWLTSRERQAVLAESKSMITSLDTHRVVSPFAGWFGSLTRIGEVPAAWKQTMIVLLVLFPIVMMEFKFLSPLTKSLNISLGTFIGNAVSVLLIAWPFTPLAIYCLRWWLVPKGENARLKTILGTVLVVALYLLSIIAFWNFL